MRNEKQLVPAITDAPQEEKPLHDWSQIKKNHKVSKKGIPYGLKEKDFFQYVRRSGKIGEIAPELKSKFSDDDLKAFGFANEMLAQAVFRNDDYAKALNVPEQMRKDIRNEKFRIERDYGTKDATRRRKNMAIYYAEEKERGQVLPLADISELNVFIHGTPAEKVTAFNKYYDKNQKLIDRAANAASGTRLERKTPAFRRQVVMLVFLELMSRIFLEAQGELDGGR